MRASDERASDERGWKSTGWPDIERRVMDEVWDARVGRLGRVEDVAALVAFLSSPAADFINGANVRVDGGHTATVS